MSRLFIKNQNHFFANPFKVILATALCIGTGKIVGKINAEKEVVPQRIQAGRISPTEGWDSFDDPEVPVTFLFPTRWDAFKQEKKVAGTIWAFGPNWSGKAGGIFLKVVPWPTNPKLKGYPSDQWKQEAMQNGMIRSLQFISFTSQVQIAGVDGLIAQYKFSIDNSEIVYYEVVAQWWKKGGFICS